MNGPKPRTNRAPLGARWLGVALLACCAHAPALAGPALERIRETRSIVLAYQPGAPFAYVDGPSKPMGYAIDLCLRLTEAVRQRLELKTIAIQFLPVTSAQRIPTMMEGKADLECGSTTNNAERRKSVAFTVPHYITGTRYMVRADSGIETLRDFDGKKLVSTQGGTPLRAIEQANRERLLGVTVLAVSDFDQAITMVETGIADGFAMDDVLLYGLIAGRLDPSKLKVVGKFLTIEPLAIMLPKNDPELKKIADDEMKRLIFSREAHAIYERWFQKPIPPKNTALNMPMNYLLKDFWKYPNDWVPD